MIDDKAAGPLVERARHLSPSDDGRAIALLVGEKLTVTLPSNPATGYCWTLASLDRAVLGFLGHSHWKELPPPAAEDGGREVWELRALSPGRTALAMEYRRPWENGTPHAAFAVNVTVIGGSVMIDPKAHLDPDGYFALVLTPASAHDLKERLATLAKPVAHHCTVRYGSRDPADLPAAFTAADLGKTFTLRVIGCKTREDGGIQAAAVALVRPDGYLDEQGISTNKVAHITVATDGKTSAVEANALLESGFQRIDGPTLTATLVHTYLTGDE
jgi:inhibitor of cysteine peptidase